MPKQHVEKIKLARLKMFLGRGSGDMAFFGHLATNLEITESRPGDGTGSKMATDGRRLYFTPKFVDAISLEQLQGVIVHEVLHCAWGHCTRRGSRNAQRWNIAADLAINPIVIASSCDLPTGDLAPVFPADYQLPDGMSADWYFDHLPEDAGQGGDGQGLGGVLDTPPETASGSDADKSGGTAVGIDWASAVANAAAYAQQRGTVSANVARMLGDIIHPATPWPDLLADWMTHRTKNDYVWAKPNRRYLAAGLYLPTLHSVELGEVVVLVDCSGSIDQATLDEFAGHVQSIVSMAPVKLHIVYHDSAVCHVDQWEPTDGDLKLSMHGGGGTSHRPAFDWITENVTDPVGVIALTDLYSDVENIAPFPTPTIFACTTERVAPWGQTIRIGG